MQTKLSRICDAIIEAGWLAAVVVAPLFFNTFSNRVFEPDKIHLVRSIALIMAAAWVIQFIDSSGKDRAGDGLWKTIRSTPLVLPTLVLVLSYLVSTALSVAPRVSLLGSYVRLQGTFSFLSYVVIGAMVLTHLRRRSQVNRLLNTIILTSLPIAIYGWLQQSGIDPLPWGGDVQSRVAGNMGNAIFIGAYLIMVMFLTLERLLASLAFLMRTERAGLGDMLRPGLYLFVFVLQFTTLVFTQSRGPQFGFLAGMYVFVMLGVLLVARWTAGRDKAPAFFRFLADHLRAAWIALLGLALGLIALILVMNIPGGPLMGLCEVKYISRSCTAISLTEGTNKVRALIWEGVVDLMLKPHEPLEWPGGRQDVLNPIRPLIGYGPESMWVVFNRFYPAELATIESRNASPDRSHNETFDTLVRGGLIQFAAEIWLFASVFFYGLRWLGLLQGRARRNLFIAFLLAGGVLGVVLPLAVESSARLSGIGMPLGLITGMLAYVTFDLLTGPDPLGSARGEGTSEADRERQGWVLAILASIVAYFVEVHLGIAIGATLTHFWVLAAAMVAIGLGWVQDDAIADAIADAAELKSVPEPSPGAAAPQPARALATSAPQRKGKGADAKRPARPAPASKPVAAARKAPERQAVGRPLPAVLAILPYAGVGALISIVLAWNYTVNLSGAQGTLHIFWTAFTTRIVNSQVVSSPMLLVLVMFTWVVGAALSVAAAREDLGGGPDAGRLTWARGITVYLAASVLSFLVFGLIQAGRLNPGSLDALAAYLRESRHIVVVDVALVISIGAIAAAIAFTRPWPDRTTAHGVIVPATIGAGLAILVAVVIVTANIQTVVADTLYKDGLGYESANDWESSVVLYREAARLQPQEDYFYLFLGRALLQYADTRQSGPGILPQNLDNVATGALLDLVEQGVRAGTQEDALRAANAALVAARRLNPLNTDHSANLARLNRAWAFTGAVPASDLADAVRLREKLRTDPGAVKREQLTRSLEYYRQAVALSPQNVGLWNEFATTQYIASDLAGAQESIQRSLALERRYYPTYVLLGDLRTAQGDAAGALEAYRQAAELAPNELSVLSALGVASSNAGDVERAVGAFEHIIALQTQALNTNESELATLQAQVTGEPDQLQPRVATRLQDLQAMAAYRRSQLYLAQRNIALIYRDAGRQEDAIAAAEQARQYATDEQQAEIEQLILQLQG